MDRFTRVVDRLYDGVTDAAAWPEALTALCEAVGAHHAIAMAGRADDASAPFLAAAGVASDHLGRFVDAVAAGPMGWLQALPPGAAFDFQAVMPRPQFVRTDFFNDVIRPMHGYRAIFAIPLREDGAEGFLALCRPERAEDFDDDQTAIVGRLVPHVTRALRGKLRLDHAALKASAAFGLLDQIDAAIAVVDRHLRPLVLNGSVEQIVARGDGLRLSEGSLTAGNPHDAARLRHLVRQAASDDARAPGQYAMRLHRPPPRPPWSLIIRRIDAPAGLARSGPLVALIPEDVTRRPDHVASVVAAAFGLTPRQAALAAHLAQGRDLDAAAARLGIGLGTARNYLKAIFARTHTRRQAELVSLILRIARFSR